MRMIPHIILASRVIVPPPLRQADLRVSALEHHRRVEVRYFVDRNQSRSHAHRQRKKKHSYSHRHRHKDRSAAFLTGTYHEHADDHSENITDYGADGSLLHDDLVDIAVWRAHRLQRSKFTDMIHGGCINRLRDHNESDHQTQRRSDQYSYARAGSEHPVEPGHTAEFARGKNLDIFHAIE